MAKRMNKRGVSEIIGYVLLMAVVITISIIVYQWLKSYVPQAALECPSGVSVAIPQLHYDCTAQTLNFTLENTGTFSIIGYYIKATNSSSQTVATIDLSQYFIGSGAFRAGNAVQYDVKSNTILPGNKKDGTYNLFNLNPPVPNAQGIKPFSGTVKMIEITPIMYVNYKGKRLIASCTSAIMDEPISCS